MSERLEALEGQNRGRVNPIPALVGDPANFTARAVAALEVRLSWQDGGVMPDTIYDVERADGTDG